MVPAPVLGLLHVHPHLGLPLQRRSEIDERLHELDGWAGIGRGRRLVDELLETLDSIHGSSRVPATGR